MRITSTTSPTGPDSTGSKGKATYHNVPHAYILPPPPMPHINNVGPPPILDGTNYSHWKFSMEAHLDSACVELWEVVKRGFEPEDPLALTPQERVDRQLNATAAHMIKKGLSPSIYDQVLLIKNAKELWERLAVMHEGTTSIQRSKYQMLKSKMDVFSMKEDETPQDCFTRLNALKVKLQGFGAVSRGGDKMDDEFIKCKFLRAVAYRHTDMVFTIQQRENFADLSADDVLAFFITHEDMVKSSQEAHVLSRDPKKLNLALKAKQAQELQEEEEDDDDEEELQGGSSEFDNDLALFVKKYHGSVLKKGTRFFKGKKRTCYNCNEENHFASDCPYEKREDKPKFEKKEMRSGKKLPNPLNKGKGLKKKEGKAFVGTTYMSDDSDDDDDEDDVVGVAGLAKLANTDSLFKYDYSEDYKGKTHKCLMAKGEMVIPNLTPLLPNPIICQLTPLDDDDIDDEEEALLIDMHTFMSTLKGKARARFQFLMDTIVERNESIEELEHLITEERGRVHLLEQELTEEKIKSASLSLSIETFQLDQDKSLAILERALAVTDELHASKCELEVVHASLTKDYESLESTHMLVKMELVNSSKTNEQLRAQLLKALGTSNAPIVLDMNACVTNSLIKQASLAHENKRLKTQLEKGLVTCIQGEKNLNDLLSQQKGRVSREGLGYNSRSEKAPLQPKKNKHVQKGHIGQSNKGTCVGSNATRGIPTHNDFAGKHNPSYVLCKSYDGDVYAKYVGPRNAFVKYAIWVPKTLVTNVKGPILKWVPKLKA